MSRNRIISVVLCVLALICGLITLTTYGLPMLDKPFAPVALAGPTAIDSDGTLTAVADSESRRLLLLDANDNLTAMIEYDSIGTPIEAVSDVCVSDGMVYVAGLKYQNDTDYITQERVLSYDANGNFRQIVYEVPDPLGFECSIKSLHAAPGGFTVGVAEIQKSPIYAAQLLHFYRVLDGHTAGIIDTDSLGTSVYDGGYSTVAGAYVITTDMGAMTGTYAKESMGMHEGHVFSAADVGDDGSTYAFDEASATLLRIKPSGKTKAIVEGKAITQVSLNELSLSYCDRSDNEVGISPNLGISIHCFSQVKPVRSLSMLFLAVMACRIYLLLFALSVVVHRVLVLGRTGELYKLGDFFASASVVIAIAIAIGYTSYKSYQEAVQTRLNIINAFAEYFELTADGYAKDVERCANRKIFRMDSRDNEQAYREATESYERLCIHAIGLASAATDNGIGTYARVYGRDDDGVFYLYDGMVEHVLGASLSSPDEAKVLAAFDEGAGSSGVLYEGSARWDTTQFRLAPLVGTDGKTVYVVVEVGSRMKSFEASVLSSLTERIASLLVMMAVIYLTYSEVRGCGSSLLKYRDYLGKDNRDALALLTRPFTFCITALSSIDSVMTVLITQQLLTSTGQSQSGILLAIPSVMLGVGLALGDVLYGYVGSKVSPRKLGLRGSMALMAFSLCAVVAVVWKLFDLYCLAKLLLSIPLGTLYSFGYSLPRRADSSKVRRPAQEGVMRTDTSAAAIGTVLGGYAAQIWGSIWVYVVMAVASVLLAAFVRYVFPAHMAPIERQHVRSLRQTLDFLGSKSILPIVLLLMFPAVLASGYDSFMFPLFSAELGLRTSTIHNISAFGKLIVYVMIGTISWASRRFDQWAVAPACVALIGLTFLLFSLNSTLIWSVVVIAVVAVLVKGSDGWKKLWLRSAKLQSFPRGRTVGMMFATRSMLLVMQPLVLTLLLTQGEHFAITALGAACAFCAVAFWCVTKGGELVPKGWEPPEPPDLFDDTDVFEEA